jgi:hypothetical protein
MDLLRKAYHKAIHTPIANIEEIWKDYDLFENSLNKLTAKKFIADHAAAYMTCRAVSKDLWALMEPIDKLKKSWICSGSFTDSTHILLLGHWKRYCTDFHALHIIFFLLRFKDGFGS